MDSQDIGTICHESNLDALVKATTWMNEFIKPSSILGYFPPNRPVRQTRYFEYLLAAVLDDSNPRVGCPPADAEAAGSQNLVTKIIHGDEEIDPSGWTKVNGKIDESLFGDTQARSCIRPLPWLSIPTSCAANIPKDLSDGFVSQVWHELVPPSDYAGRKNKLLCVDIQACVYFLRHIFANPLPAEGEEHNNICKELQTIEAAANIAQSAIAEQCCRASPGQCGAGADFRIWVTTNSADPIDTLDVTEMVDKRPYLHSRQICYLTAVREHLFAIMGLSNVLLKMVSKAA